jgi:NADP-dependent 3-hydroxy acid dehydrogenase YdfG
MRHQAGKRSGEHMTIGDTGPRIDSGRGAQDRRRVAVVTGASSGIGAATAVRLAREGFDVVLGARRVERLAEVAKACEGRPRVAALDVTDAASVQEFCKVAREAGPVHVLVNNAGGAHGLQPAIETEEDDWRWMYEANVLGVLRVTRSLLPALDASGDGHIVVVGSLAGVEVYPGGAGYTAAKHAVHALVRTLRLELLGRPVRVTEVAPGMVATEFSQVRLGSQEAADAVYANMTPLVAEDVADVISFCVTRPAHVNLDYVRVMPRDQADGRTVHRRSTPLGN